MWNKKIKLEKIDYPQVLKALELAEKEGERNVYGIEKEFAFINGATLFPIQKIGRQSAYKFITTYGELPYEIRIRMMPEVFDYMIETITEPEISYCQAVNEILWAEANLWLALDHIKNVFPNMEDILLSSGTLYKPAMINSDNIPEVWGRDKKAYLEEMVRRYGDRLTPQGMHGNVSIPEPLIAYQYHRSDTKKERGSTGYVDFKNEVYIWLARRLRAFASLIIAIEANSPFDYVIEDEKVYTVLTGFHSNRWARLPRIESTSYPLMLKDYRHFQLISRKLIDKGIIIGANNYMPVRPKGERRLGEVPLSFERACWFHNVVLDSHEFDSNLELNQLREDKDLTFIERLEIAEKIGWLKKTGYTLNELIRLWQKDNVRRLLGVPLNRIEIRCEESGGDYEFEIAKGAFIYTLCLYLFCEPEFGSGFRYNKNELKRIDYNENMAMKYGLNCEIFEPFSGNKIHIRNFLREVLNRMGKFSREIGTFNDLKTIYELACGGENESEKKIRLLLKYLGNNPEKTKNGFIIVPDEFIKNLLLARKKYLFKEVSERLNWGINLEQDNREIYKQESLAKSTK